jgi:hypothetical protein
MIMYDKIKGRELSFFLFKVKLIKKIYFRLIITFSFPMLGDWLEYAQPEEIRQTKPFRETTHKKSVN